MDNHLSSTEKNQNIKIIDNVFKNPPLPSTLQIPLYNSYTLESDESNLGRKRLIVCKKLRHLSLKTIQSSLDFPVNSRYIKLLPKE